MFRLGLSGPARRAGSRSCLLDRVGRFLARIEGPVAGNVLLRRAQYRQSDQPEEIVRGFVIGKISNQRSVLMRGLRDHGSDLEPDQKQRLSDTTDRLARILRRVTLAMEHLDELRGAEGEAASLYFRVFDLLITLTRHRTAF